MKLLLKAQILDVPDVVGKMLVGDGLHAHVGRAMRQPILGLPVEFEEVKERKIEEEPNASQEQERAPLEGTAESTQARDQEEEAEARSPHPRRDAQQPQRGVG